VFSPSQEIPTACLTCGPSDDLVHTPLFIPCVSSTLLVGICPSQLPCCCGAGASSASFLAFFPSCSFLPLKFGTSRWRKPSAPENCRCRVNPRIRLSGRDHRGLGPRTTKDAGDAR
jgi:hypothetical protein